jgi:hypothetical protein
MVIDMNKRTAEVLRRSHELLERGDEVLATPRPEGREWRLPERESEPEVKTVSH